MGHERAEIHEEAAVTLQADDAPLRLAQRQPQRVRAIEPHRAHGKIVERALSEREPIDGGRISRNHDLVAHVPRQRAKAFIALHHAVEGLRPINNVSGCEAA